MAKKVRGIRANKPNASFGTINSETLYKDDEDDTPEVEASEDTEQPESNSFVETKEEKPDHDYKKRYDDLKRHYDKKLTEFEEEKRQLATATQQANVPMPKTVEELEEFKTQYPDVYGVVETVAAMQANERTSELQKELEVIKEREKETVVQAAYRELTNNHPDFDEIKTDEKFLNWLQEQPESISDGIYNNNTAARWASRVLYLNKADAGISKRKTSKAKADAATSVRAPKAREITSEQGGDKRIWKASEIRSLKPWEFEKLESELDSARQEGRIDPNN